jgi:tetratricopeptide (TPR) repeat protein
LVIVFLLPRKPESAPEAAISVAMEALDPVQEAVALVQGEDPMAGIMALRELAEGDEPNIDAIVWLGLLSIQSGQLDKARDRFAEVLSMEPGNVEATWQLALMDMEVEAYDRATVGFESCFEADSVSFRNAQFFAARCYEAMGNEKGALANYKAYLPFAPDTIVAVRVREMIVRLEAGSVGINE